MQGKPTLTNELRDAARNSLGPRTRDICLSAAARLATYEAALKELLQSAEDATDMEDGTQSINLEMAIERARKALEDK